MKSARRSIVHAALVSGIAFATHLVWELWQCPRYYVHGTVPPTGWAMLWATAGDVVLTWIAHLAVAASRRRWLWCIEPWGWRTWAVLTGVALLLAFPIEWHALATGRWSYLPAAPLVPGTRVSVLPVAQLVLLFPLTFAASGFLLEWTSRR